MFSYTGSSNSTIRTAALGLMALGAILLLVMPLTLLYFAVANVPNPHLPGTLVIVTATGGMGLLGIGAVLRS